ncbi:DUF2946 family protein [Marinobacter mobilis]|uniref:DUF2946 domain-containing protein n=1 Tax=Marinobacter mobilis TaxID=488533 RepID=A0A1H3DFM9_9GAMM|nr:DUF2946 family protein [Marinobacter mobilis]SDX65196.1 hypothetical protein SAMN04487960_11271 [Marinobacter mobilis]
MTSLQRFQTPAYARRQQAWLVLVLCCFLVQALSPRGYMPAASTTGFPALGFCGDPIPGLEQLLDLGAFPDTAPDHPDFAHEQTHCVFSVVAQVAAVAETRVQPQAPRTVSLPLATAARVAAGSLTYRLPDSRAPPIQTV